MRQINLTEAKSRFKYCAINDSPALVEVSILSSEDVKRNKVYACAPFLIGYIKTDALIVSDPVVKDEELKQKFCSVFPPFDLPKSECKEPKKSNTLLMLEDKEAEIFKTVHLLKHICFTLSKEAGWHDNPREDGTMLALIHSEISEALEGVRKDINDDHLPHHKMVTVELADAIIRIMDYAGSRDLDISSAIIEKLKYNQQRQDHKRENRNQDGGKKF